MSLAALGTVAGCGGGGGEITNPVVISPLDVYKNYTNLFGDIHVHTNLSDGDESPDFALRYARDASKLDFCCLSDHAEIMVNDGLAGLPHYKTMPAKYDEPGKFSATEMFIHSTTKFPYCPASRRHIKHLKNYGTPSPVMMSSSYPTIQ